MADFTFAHREEGFDEHIDWSIRGYRHLLEDVISFSRSWVEWFVRRSGDPVGQPPPSNDWEVDDLVCEVWEKVHGGGDPTRQ